MEAVVTPAIERDRYAQARLEIAEASAFDLPYAIMNFLATVVACYGLLANSPAVVIGAMILAMLLGPISGVALALVDGDIGLLRKALFAELGGVLLVVVTAFVVGFVHRDIPLTHEIMVRTAPNFFDLMIALASGAAGAYASVSTRLSVAFIGVAVATALVPPLACCGMLLARGDAELAGGAFYLPWSTSWRSKAPHRSSCGRAVSRHDGWEGSCFPTSSASVCC